MTGNDRVSQDAAAAGAALYSDRVLRIYDVLVHGISNRFIWKCPTREIRRLYDQHVSNNHLDVGVGTGLFLDRCRFPSPTPRVVLMDLNENCLKATARRIARYQPMTRRCNILEPIDWTQAGFDSIGLSYVLHCLPGSMSQKAAAFDHLGKLLNPGGVILGTTLLTVGVQRGWAARRLMRYYNAKRIFSNAEDSLDGLQAALASRFSKFAVTTAGCAAFFQAIK